VAYLGDNASWAAANNSWNDTMGRLTLANQNSLLAWSAKNPSMPIEQKAAYALTVLAAQQSAAAIPPAPTTIMNTAYDQANYTWQNAVNSLPLAMQSQLLSWSASQPQLPIEIKAMVAQSAMNPYFKHNNPFSPITNLADHTWYVSTANNYADTLGLKDDIVGAVMSGGNPFEATHKRNEYLETYWGIKPADNTLGNLMTGLAVIAGVIITGGIVVGLLAPAAAASAGAAAVTSAAAPVGAAAAVPATVASSSGIIASVTGGVSAVGGVIKSLTADVADAKAALDTATKTGTDITAAVSTLSTAAETLTGAKAAAVPVLTSAQNTLTTVAAASPEHAAAASEALKSVNADLMGGISTPVLAVGIVALIAVAIFAGRK